MGRDTHEHNMNLQRLVYFPGVLFLKRLIEMTTHFHSMMIHSKKLVNMKAAPFTGSFGKPECTCSSRHASQGSRDEGDE